LGRRRVPLLIRDPAAEAAPRCRAVRLPAELVEPPVEQFEPF
jgi:hypothetical protein